MVELVEQILSLPKATRLKIAMQILMSIHDEEGDDSDSHTDELEKFQAELAKENVSYYSESEFWTEARKRVS